MAGTVAVLAARARFARADLPGLFDLLLGSLSSRGLLRRRGVVKDDVSSMGEMGTVLPALPPLTSLGAGGAAPEIEQGKRGVLVRPSARLVHSIESGQ